METDHSLFSRLWQDLLPYSGRGNQVFRTVLTSVIVIIISQTFQIPWLALSLITVFFVSQTNVVLTRLTGVLFLAGTMLAVSLSLLMLQVTWNVPLLRIIIASVIFFASVFFMRTSPLYGAVFFVVAIVVIYSQSLVDISEDAEQVVRNILWVSISINYSICIAMMINTFLLPVEPADKLKSIMHNQINIIIQRLYSSQKDSQKEIGQAGREMQSMYQLLRYSTMRSSEYRKQQDRYVLMVSTLAELRALACHLPMKKDLGEYDLKVIDAIKGRCFEIQESIKNDKLEISSHPLNACAENVILNRMIHVMNEHSENTKSVNPQAGVEKSHFLLPDTFSNRRYIIFASKTLLSAIICYFIYTAIDWPGIHTIMLSCLIVAQPGLGNVQRKIILRMAGAVIGGVTALLAVIYVIPHIDTVFGLLMLVIPVLIGSSWIANGSENISYAGVQIMFTFSLAILESFTPVYELSEIRDRLVGIVAGIFIAGIVHAIISPEREGNVLLNRLAELVNKTKLNLTHNEKLQNKYSTVITSLAECESLASCVVLEPNWNASEGSHDRFNQKFNNLMRKVGSIIILANELGFVFSQLSEIDRKNVNTASLACEEQLDAITKWLSGEVSSLLIVNIPVSTDSPEQFRHAVFSFNTAVNNLRQITMPD